MSDFDARELIEGWDEDEETTEVAQPTLVEAVSEEPEKPEPEPEDEDEEVAAEVEQEEGDEQEEQEEEGEEAEDSSQEDAEVEDEAAAAQAIAAFDVDDPDVLAYLAQYQGDPVKALRAAAELRRAYGRQGTDLAAVRQRAIELESQITQARLLSGGVPLSEEQANWAEGAAQSINPGAYVQQAIQAGEFDLARAVCTYWAQNDPFNAGRAGQLVDNVEQQTRQQMQAPVQASTEDILQALWENVPGMKEWEPQMVSVYQHLGPSHHLVQESRSNDPDVAMRALINIYEIAKASSANVVEQKTEIKKKARADADSAKAKAAVTSAASSPKKAAETPRDREIMPGLTLADLETEFATS